MSEELQWDFDEAMLQYDMQQKRACDAEAEVARLSKLLALQPCGHPVCAIRCENPNAEQTTNWCGWCADIEKARQEGMIDGVQAAVKLLMELDGATDA